MSSELVVRGRRVVRAGRIEAASIHIDQGRITSIGNYDDTGAEPAQVIEAGELVVLPGLVDSHVHVNEPGRTEWEGFRTATRAAAAGGVTTLIDMPLNSIPTTVDVEALRTKQEALAGQLVIDTGLWGGVIPGNVEELGPMLEGGVLGFKCFLVDSGIDEFPEVGEADVRTALGRLAELGAPLLVHAELQGPIDRALAELAAKGDADHCRYETFLATRPRAAEDEAIRMMIRLCRESGAPIHIVHHSSADALMMLEAARQEGLPVTAETCPHYLHFAAEEIPDGATQFKCVPPIREAENREQLWNALAGGLIDQVVSDHSPCSPELKLLDLGRFDQAWGGIASLQLGLSVVWTDARKRGFGLVDVARWMAEAPARLAGLDGQKGRIEVGYDADLVLFDDAASTQVHGAHLEHRHPVTPYDGRELTGVVKETLLRGQTVYKAGQLAYGANGRLLGRSTG